MEVGRSPPEKGSKLLTEDVEVRGASGENPSPQPQPNIDILQSPVTVPMLFPEMWEKIFEYLPPSDVETVLNSSPHWNRILINEKPKTLFSKVLACMGGQVNKNYLLPFRLVSKACRAGVDLAFPENATIILEEIRREEEEIQRLRRIRLLRPIGRGISIGNLNEERRLRNQWYNFIRKHCNN